MARIYLGVRRGPFAATKLVVVKQLRESVVLDKQFLEMFMDEARITLRLNHPNVVHTYEVVSEGPDYYLSMEFLEGQSLLDVIRRIGREGIPIDEHLWILSQTLAGLHYAHELREFDGTPLGIVHRDVTPSNVFICYSGAVKLLDFGIAKAAGAIATTQQGMVKGKLGYIAPEQCLGTRADVRSDVYMVGVMLWEALARRRRATAETRAARLLARATGSEPDIEQVWPSVPKPLAAITAKALARDPRQRYGSAQEFQSDLESYLSRRSRRVGPDTIAALLKPHFEAERMELQHAISAYLSRPETSPSTAPIGRAWPSSQPIEQAPLAPSSNEVARPHRTSDAPTMAQGRDRRSAAEVECATGLQAAHTVTVNRGDSASARRVGARWRWPAALAACAAVAVLAPRIARPPSQPRITKQAVHGAPKVVATPMVAERPVEPQLDVSTQSVTRMHLAWARDRNPHRQDLSGDTLAPELESAAEARCSQQQPRVPPAHAVDLDLSLQPANSISVAPTTWAPPLAATLHATREPVPSTVRIEPGMDMRRHVRAYPKRSIYKRDPYEP